MDEQCRTTLKSFQLEKLIPLFEGKDNNIYTIFFTIICIVVHGKD